MSVGMSLEEALETIKSQNQIIMQLAKEKCALQAKIDALMLEYCPEEMTKDQLEQYEISIDCSNSLDSLSSLVYVNREVYGNDKCLKPNNHCYWDNNYWCWLENDNHYKDRIKDLVTKGDLT